MRLARSHGRWRECIAAGWDADDLEQEVLVRLVARQAGRSAYDPSRAGVGKYLFVSTYTILGQLLAKRTTAKERLVRTGVVVQDEAGTVEVDASEVAVATSRPPRLAERRLACCQERETYERYLARRRGRWAEKKQRWRRTVSTRSRETPQEPAKDRKVPQRAAQRVTTWRDAASVLGLSEDTLARRRRAAGDTTPTPPWFADEQAVIDWYEQLRASAVEAG